MWAKQTSLSAGANKPVADCMAPDIAASRPSLEGTCLSSGMDNWPNSKGHRLWGIIPFILSSQLWTKVLQRWLGLLTSLLPVLEVVEARLTIQEKVEGQLRGPNLKWIFMREWRVKLCGEKDTVGLGYEDTHGDTTTNDTVTVVVMSGCRICNTCY